VRRVDVWGKKPEYLQKYQAHLTPMLEAEGLPRGARRELRDHGVPLQQARPDAVLSPGSGRARDGRQRDVLLDRHVYPLLTRATYPTLGFPQYPGEVGTSEADDAMKAKAQQDAEAALAEPLEAFRKFSLEGEAVRRG
jgi:glutathione S-transferase